MVFRQSLKILCLSLAMGFAAVGLSHAVQPSEVLQDPALEARARALSESNQNSPCFFPQ